MISTAERLFQSLLDEYRTPEAALRQLSDRFVVECERTEQLETQVEQLNRLRSWAYSREAAPVSGKIDDVPNPITDEWVATAREA
jgi:hypothetical protein